MFVESLTAISPNTCFLFLIVLRALIMTTLTHLQHNYKEFRVSLFYFVIILRWSSFSEASFFRTICMEGKGKWAWRIKGRGQGGERGEGESREGEEEEINVNGDLFFFI